MAGVKYLLKGKNDITSIYVRFFHSKEIDITKTTNILINRKYWNSKNGTLKQVSEFKEKLNIQNSLNRLTENIINQYSNDNLNGVIIDGIWLENIINSTFNKTNQKDLTIFTNYIENFIENLDFRVNQNGKIGVSKVLKFRYKSLNDKILDFEKYSNKKLKISNIDLIFYKKFVNFLSNEKKLAINTIGKQISLIKTVCNEAKNENFVVSNDILKRNFKTLKEGTLFVTLNEYEIEKIFNHRFNEDYLENAKNWLIISCWTGARSGDLLEFTNENIKNDFLEYTSKKTNKKIILPLHWQVKSILKDLNNFPRKISQQKYNQYIKKVCFHLGLNEIVKGKKLVNFGTEKKPIWRKETGFFKKYELISSHIGRRSFATNHYGKLPTPIIMSATGHTTEKMLLNYIGKTPIDNAEILKDFWNNERAKSKPIKLNIV